MKSATLVLCGAFLLTLTATVEAADPMVVRGEPTVIYAPPMRTIVEAPVVEIEPVVPRYFVDHGPHYSGPAVVDFPKPVFHETMPVRNYPYVRTWEAAQAAAQERMYYAPRVYRYHRYRGPISRYN